MYRLKRRKIWNREEISNKYSDGYDDMDDVDEKALIENDVREQALHVLNALNST